MSSEEQKFVLDSAWRIMLADLGLSEQAVLHRATLPPDLLEHHPPCLSSEEYFRFWGAMIDLAGDSELPLRLVESITAETFSPPILAALCSADWNAALERLAVYKPLVGPLELRVNQTRKQTTVVIEGLIDSPGCELVVAAELAFFVRIARLATRQKIVPLKIRSAVKLKSQTSYEKFFGIEIESSRDNAIVLSAADAALPFLTANETMTAFLEPNLKKQLDELATQESYRQRVRVCITDVLSSGDLSVGSIAKQLAVSTRTLQRKLSEEGTSFHKELILVRQELANHYLASTAYSTTDISFLLGYLDPSSFYRAFQEWTGTTPEAARNAARR